jgi:hypothetical protein
MMAYPEEMERGAFTAARALQIFDELEPVDLDFMTGAWKGEGFSTGHPLDGLLEAYHWHGKTFEDAENVHPLVFTTLSGSTAFVNPKFMGPFLGMLDKMPKSPFMVYVLRLGMMLFTTSRSCARLRMTTFRGKSSASMIYDRLPIIDVFRKIDENVVLGVMDLKGMSDPFFFILRRNTT